MVRFRAAKGRGRGLEINDPPPTLFCNQWGINSLLWHLLANSVQCMWWDSQGVIMTDYVERRNRIANAVINLLVLTCGVLAGILVELSFVGFVRSYDAH